MCTYIRRKKIHIFKIYFILTSDNLIRPATFPPPVMHCFTHIRLSSATLTLARRSTPFGPEYSYSTVPLRQSRRGTAGSHINTRSPWRIGWTCAHHFTRRINVGRYSENHRFQKRPRNSRASLVRLLVDSGCFKQIGYVLE